MGERIGVIAERHVPTYPRHYGGGVVERKENLGRTRIMTIPVGELSVTVTSERNPQSGLEIPTIAVTRPIDAKDSVELARIYAQGRMYFGPRYEFFTQPGGDNSHERHIGTGSGEHVSLALARDLSRDANLIDGYEASSSWVSPELVGYITSLSSSYGRMFKGIKG